MAEKVVYHPLSIFGYCDHGLFVRASLESLATPLSPEMSVPFLFAPPNIRDSAVLAVWVLSGALQVEGICQFMPNIWLYCNARRWGYTGQQLKLLELPRVLTSADLGAL